MTSNMRNGVYKLNQDKFCFVYIVRLDKNSTGRETTRTSEIHR